jgi:rsbT co-antagonist protein RsbR
LGLIDVTPILKGISPEMAIKIINFDNDFRGITIESNLELAVKIIGFILEKTEDN